MRRRLSLEKLKSILRKGIQVSRLPNRNELDLFDRTDTEPVWPACMPGGSGGAVGRNGLYGGHCSSYPPLPNENPKSQWHRTTIICFAHEPRGAWGLVSSCYVSHGVVVGGGWGF